MTDVDQLVAEAARAAVVSAADAVTSALSLGIERLAQQVDDVTTNMLSAIRRDNPAFRQRMFQTLGRNAQLSMLDAYGQLVTRREGPADRTHYRAGQGRFAGGVLLQALGSADFFEATPNGLAWGNIAALDAAARHWHRIAFGAGGRGAGGSAHYPVTFKGLASIALGYDETPSPGFSMPAGVWISGEDGSRVQAGRHPNGSDAFYPVRVNNTVEISKEASPGRFGQLVRSQSVSLTRNGTRIRQQGRPEGLRPTRGIQGKDFFNAGVRRIANDLPKVIDDYVDSIFGSWTAAAKKRTRLSVQVDAPTIKAV